MNDKDLLSIEVSKMYYILDKTQQEIAEKLQISRPTVSKLLKHAKEKNYIQIKIENPLDAVHTLENKLKEKFNLKDVKIAYVNPTVTSVNDIQNLIGIETASYLSNIVKDHDSIGITWGETMWHVAQQLKAKSVNNVEIIQLKGGMNLVHEDTHDQDIMMHFVKNFSAKGQYIPLPVIFESQQSKYFMLKEKQTQLIMNKMENVTIALYTIGNVSKDSLLYKMNYITEDEFLYLKDHAVGDICSRFIDKSGDICLDDLNSRTFGIHLDKLAKVENSILVASGSTKIKGIYTALENKIPNVLITDSKTALELLAY